MGRLSMVLLISAALIAASCSTPADMDQKSSSDTKDNAKPTLRDLHRGGVTSPGGIGGFGR